LEVDLLHTVEEILAQRFRAACEKLEDGARSQSEVLKFLAGKSCLVKIIGTLQIKIV
jgi:hypothetical protein